MKSIEEFEIKINKIKEENQAYKEKIAGLKKENSSLKIELRDKDVIHHNTPAGVILILQGKILQANDTFLELIGYDLEEIINQHYLDFIDPAYLIDVRIRHKKWNAEKAKKDQYDTSFITKTGDSVICSVESKRARYKRKASYVLNITRLESRKREQDTKKSEIKDKTVKKMITGFSREQEKNAASLLEMTALLKNNEAAPDKQLKELIFNLESRAKNFLKQTHMLKLIADDSKDYNEKKRFKINTVIEDAVSSILESIDERENEITINTYFRSSSFIEGNPDDFKEAMGHVLFHITENMNDGGDIHITTEENTDFSYIYIQDNRIGNHEDSIKNLFYPYYKINGLGLAFSKAVVTRHNGTMEAITGEGEGIAYQIILPLAPKIKKKKRIDKSKLKKSRVLIIQEDDVARELITHLLMDKGCRLDTSKTCLEGLAKIKKNKINMVIADTDSIEMDISAFLTKCKRLNPKMLNVCIGDRKGKNRVNKKDIITPDLYFFKPIAISRVVKEISQLLTAGH